ncbi:hypothetical protein ACLBX9_07560 [Methylobacterium sp. A49B]
MTNEAKAQPTEARPALQVALDGLVDGQSPRLTNAECDRLFGVNDALVGRVANCARGHQGIVL